MSSEKLIPTSFVGAESGSATSVRKSTRLRTIRNAGLVVAASLPLLFGSEAASAAGGQSKTTTREEGPKCMEVFGHLSNIDIDLTDAGNIPLRLSNSMNTTSSFAATEAVDERYLGSQSIIFLDCNISPAQDTATTGDVALS